MSETQAVGKALNTAVDGQADNAFVGSASAPGVGESDCRLDFFN